MRFFRTTTALRHNTICVGFSTRIPQMNCLTSARDLRQPPGKQVFGHATCQRDRGTQWVTAKTGINGHFECTCYHPLFLFNQDGDLERAMLRRGNHASAKFWRRVLLPVIERYRHLDIPKFFRGDAAFARPALYRLLENEDDQYAIRIPANDVLEREIAHLLTRPVGRPPKKPIVLYAGFLYRAAS